jgi:hypothetical protein
MEEYWGGSGMKAEDISKAVFIEKGLNDLKYKLSCVEAPASKFRIETCGVRETTRIGENVMPEYFHEVVRSLIVTELKKKIKELEDELEAI